MKNRLLFAALLSAAPLFAQENRTDALRKYPLPVCSVPRVEAPPVTAAPTDSIRPATGYFYIDGIRVRSCRASFPDSAVEEVTVITGGLPVYFGDLKGSVISVGPSSAPAEPNEATSEPEKE